MKILLFTLLFVLGLSISCKKKDVPCDQTIEKFTNDTILPSDYLMTYPGSWWEYHDGTKDSCTNWINVAYKVVTDCDGCEITNLDHHYLPYSTRFGLIDYQTQVNNSSNDSTRFSPILGGQNIGDLFYYKSTPSGPSAAMPVNHLNYKYYENHLATYTVQNLTYNDVKVIREELYTQVSQSTVLLFATFVNHFAKDVGLIETRTYDNEGTCVDSLELVNHYIAPH